MKSLPSHSFLVVKLSPEPNSSLFLPFGKLASSWGCPRIHLAQTWGDLWFISRHQIFTNKPHLTNIALGIACRSELCFDNHQSRNIRDGRSFLTAITLTPMCHPSQMMSISEVVLLIYGFVIMLSLTNNNSNTEMLTHLNMRHWRTLQWDF